MTAALNSGQINAVSFPQAEAGLSLIELVGTIEVTASISVLYTRRVVGATTTASAQGSADTTMVRQVYATTQAGAIASAVNLTKVTNNQATTAARMGRAHD